MNAAVLCKLSFVNLPLANPHIMRIANATSEVETFNLGKTGMAYVGMADAVENT